MTKEFTRRRALSSFAVWAAGSPLLKGQGVGLSAQGEPPGRIAPVRDLVNTFEFENRAQRKLAAPVFAAIAGGDRGAFERIIFRPRMLVDTSKLDLTLELFGEKLFAPILVGPASDQQRFHTEGELATVRGAAAAKAAVVISDRSSNPIEKIAAAGATPLWYQVYPQPDMGPVLARVQAAVKAGCKTVLVTVGTPYQPVEGVPHPSKLAAMSNPRMDWSVIDQVRQSANVPVLLKGVMSPEEAKTAAGRGIAGIVVSNHGGVVPGVASPIEMLGPVVDAVGGKVPVLVDGGFRRGSDILKGLALGARAVLVARPALWGLAAYGAEGVQAVLEMLQTETGRMMAGAGQPNLASIHRNLVRWVKR
jgi:4-hydroxymandelate oxidase